MRMVVQCRHKLLLSCNAEPQSGGFHVVAGSWTPLNHKDKKWELLLQLFADYDEIASETYHMILFH